MFFSVVHVFDVSLPILSELVLFDPVLANNLCGFGGPSVDDASDIDVTALAAALAFCGLIN